MNHEDQEKPSPIAPIANAAIDPIFEATVAGDRGSDRQCPGRRADDDRCKGRAHFGIPHDELRAILKRYNRLEERKMKNLPRVTYSNTGEDFSGVHAHLDEIIPEAEARLLGKSSAGA